MTIPITIMIIIIMPGTRMFHWEEKRERELDCHLGRAPGRGRRRGCLKQDQDQSQKQDYKIRIKDRILIRIKNKILIRLKNTNLIRIRRREKRSESETRSRTRS